MLVCAFPEPPCSLLSHPGLPGQRLPPRVPGGAGTPAATGARPRAARCAWDRRLPRGVQLLPAPNPPGQHHTCPGKVLQLPTLPSRQHLIPAHKGQGRSSAGSIRHSGGTARHPRLASEGPAVMPDKLQTAAPLLVRDGAQSLC